jgi:hypothetical protein
LVQTRRFEQGLVASLEGEIYRDEHNPSISGDGVLGTWGKDIAALKGLFLSTSKWCVSNYDA